MVKRPIFLETLIGVCIVAYVCWTLVNVDITDVSGTQPPCPDSSAREYAVKRMNVLPEDAVLFTTQGWFYDLYIQQVENRRPDVDVLFWYAFDPGERFPGILEFNYPRLQFPQSTPDMSREDRVMHMVAANLRNRPVFFDVDTRQHQIMDHLMPWFVYYRVVEEEIGELTPELIEQIHENCRWIADTWAGDADWGARRQYALPLAVIATYFYDRNLLEDALRLFEMAYQVDTGFYEAIYMQGVVYHYLGNKGKAQEWLTKAEALEPWRKEAGEALEVCCGKEM